MFCTLFSCVQARQNRLHLSQRDATEKSECKTLISSDPDEGFITESAGDSTLPVFLLVHLFGAKLAAFQTSGVALRWEIRLCVGDCMHVCTVQVACLIMNVHMQMREQKPGCRASVVVGNHTSENLHLQRKCLWFPVKRLSTLMGCFTEIADQLPTLLCCAIKRISTF